MKELFQHIEHLIAGHDCVVVPGLGGFILHEVTFRTDKNRDVFLPCGKEISFNVRLTFNDGVLVQAIQESQRITFEAAVERVREAVNSLHDKLNEGHVVAIGRLGTLRKHEDGQLLFRPDNRNLFSPDAYGLTPFVFQTLGHRSDNRPFLPIKQEKRDHRTRLERFTVVHWLTGAAAFLLLFLIAIPAGELHHYKTQEAFLLHNYFESGLDHGQFMPDLTNSYGMQLPSETTESSALDAVSGAAAEDRYVKKSKPHTRTRKRIIPSTDDIDSLFGLIKSMAASTRSEDSAEQKNAKDKKIDTTGRTVESNTETSPIPTPSTGSIKAQTPSATPSIPKSSEKAYCIIVSSHPTKRLAQKWLQSQPDDLSQNASLVEGNGRIRVSVSRFSNKREAESYLNQWRKENPNHADAWLLATYN